MERFHAMREMFASLRAQGTSIIILSNNGWATTQAKEEFVKILQIYDPELKKEDVVYGDQNKARVFRQASRFKSTRRVLKNR
jgi:ribonucleotide monophosphatase NagD (HAD superfamily)